MKLAAICSGVLTIILIVGATIAYYVIVARIRSELAELVRTRLGGELRDASISWRPPYRVTIRDARVIVRDRTAGEVQLLRVGGIAVTLWELPAEARPVHIRDLTVHDPEIHLVRRKIPPKASQETPDDSEVETSAAIARSAASGRSIRIDRLHVTGGAVQLEDRSRPHDPPARLGNIGIDLAPAGPDSRQPFEMVAGPDGAGVRVRGVLRNDDLVLEIAELKSDLHLSPGGVPATFLPAALRDYHVEGDLKAQVEGIIPLRDWSRATFDGTVDAQHVTARAVGSATPLDQGRLALSFERPASTGVPAPIHARLVAGTARVGNAVLKLERGELWDDPAQDQWKAGSIAGRLEIAKPRDADVAGSFWGHFNFTAAASGPLHPAAGQSALDAIRCQALVYLRDVAFQPRKWPLPMEHIGGGTLRLFDREIHVADLTANYGGDDILLHAARITVPANVTDLWQVETRIEDIAGSVTCNQPSPPYPLAMGNIMAQLRPVGTFQAQGRLTLPQGSPKPKGDFHFDIISDGRASMVVTDRQITLTQIQGRASISRMLVDIAATEARCLGGTVMAQLKVTPRENDAPIVYEGRGWVRDIDMALLARALDLRRDGASRRLSGTGSGTIDFSGIGAGGPVSPLSAFAAKGDLQLANCNFWDDPVLGRVAGQVKTTRQPGIGDAAAVFSIDRQIVTLHEAAINSPSIGVEGRGTIGFDQQVDLTVVAVPLGDLREKLKQTPIPVVNNLAAGFAGLAQGLFKGAAGALIYQYHITGPATHTTQEVVPAPALTDSAATVFGQMLGNGKDPLIDSVRTLGGK